MLRTRKDSRSSLFILIGQYSSEILEGSAIKEVES